MATSCGIRVTVRGEKQRKAIEAVLEKIGRRRPKDLATLQQRVRAIVPLGRKEMAEGVAGEWRVDALPEPDFDNPDPKPTGVVAIRSCGNERDFVANLAHELGHACTTYEDLANRGDCPWDEWCSELAADWYAGKRWGFRREIARTARWRKFSHHAAAAGLGYVEEAGPDGYWYRYTVDREYMMHAERKGRVTARERKAIAEAVVSPK